jgi:hypothetical protein
MEDKQWQVHKNAEISHGYWSLRQATDGKRIKRTRTIKADGIRKARKKLAEFQTEVEAGEYIAPNKMTFAAFELSLYLAIYKLVKSKPCISSILSMI